MGAKECCHCILSLSLEHQRGPGLTGAEQGGEQAVQGSWGEDVTRRHAQMVR